MTVVLDFLLKKKPRRLKKRIPTQVHGSFSIDPFLFDLLTYFCSGSKAILCYYSNIETVFQTLLNANCLTV